MRWLTPSLIALSFTAAACAPTRSAPGVPTPQALCDEIERAAVDAAAARERSEADFREAAEALMFVLRVEGAGNRVEGEDRERLREMGGLPGARERTLALAQARMLFPGLRAKNYRKSFDPHFLPQWICFYQTQAPISKPFFCPGGGRFFTLEALPAVYLTRPRQCYAWISPCEATDKIIVNTLPQCYA